MDDAVTTHDGKVYVVGGSNGDYALPNANVYDPATGAWSAIAPLPEPLNASSAGFIGDTLYVAGGWGRFGDPSTDVWAYDPVGNSWTRAASLPSGGHRRGQRRGRRQALRHRRCQRRRRRARHRLQL